MIELYKLHWSHYVEKVRWALDFKQLPWRGIDIVAFSKQEMKQFDCPQTVPMIHDQATGAALSDSSPIIRYLDETYPQRPLLPPDPVERKAVWQCMLRLDSTLGLHARRLGYTQVIMECPRLLSSLFMAGVWGGVFTRPVLRSLTAPVLGGLLAMRFRFHRNREDGVYEALEAELLPIACRLGQSRFLVGDHFTAADITLASLLRPLRIVPYFRQHSSLRVLFEWQQRLFGEHGRDEEFPYEEAIRKTRQRSGEMRGLVRWMSSGYTSPHKLVTTDALQVARNDIHEVSRWMLPLGLLVYLRLRWFSGVGVQSSMPAAG